MISPLQYIKELNASISQSDEKSHAENKDAILKKFHMIVDVINEEWTGTYQEALKKQPLPKHLNQECGICLDSFKLEDRVVILSCTHGFHEKCMQPMIKEACPYDKTPRITYQVNWLGYSVLCSSNSSIVGKSIANHKEKINSTMEMLATEISKSGRFTELLNDAFVNSVLLFIKTVIQNSLDVHNGNQQSIHNLDDLVEVDLIRLSAIIDQIRITDIDFLIDYDLINLKSSSSIIQVFNLANEYNHRYLEDRINISSDGFKLVWGYLSTLLGNFKDNPRIREFAERIDLRFLARHFKEIRLQSTSIKKRQYLSSVNDQALLRLHNLTNKGQGPTAQLIQSEIKKRKYCKILNKIAKKKIVTLISYIFCEIIRNFFVQDKEKLIGLQFLQAVLIMSFFDVRDFFEASG